MLSVICNGICTDRLALVRPYVRPEDCFRSNSSKTICPILTKLYTHVRDHNILIKFDSHGNRFSHLGVTAHYCKKNELKKYLVCALSGKVCVQSSPNFMPPPEDFVRALSWKSLHTCSYKVTAYSVALVLTYVHNFTHIFMSIYPFCFSTFVPVSVEISCVSNFYTVRSTCLKHTQMFILYVQIILNNRYGSYFLWQKIGSGGIRILWTHF